ncbi:hypothetical protein WJX73_001096 [Symbiochloris irregularis]|uniref:Outer envelope protein 61 n=1 Tax=Symbiochloris irregularis TaxID=706552 RepID=A0AAW1NRU4_9CHLO
MNNMMSPEMMQMAMDQMSKMTPEQMAQMQRQMGSFSPDMMQQSMQMFQNMTPDQRAQVQRQAQGITPEQRAAMTQQAGISHPEAQRLRAEGNNLHKAGSYKAASEKYEAALKEISGKDGEEASTLRKACRLNLSSCYLNIGKYKACVEHCSAVLRDDRGNSKALYRRGQAHMAEGSYGEAVKDLKGAVKHCSPGDRPVIQEKLQAAQEKAGSRIDDDDSDDDDSSIEDMPALSREQPTRIEEISTAPGTSSQQSGPAFGNGAIPRPTAEQMKEMSARMRENPDMMRQMFDMSPEQMQQMAAASGMAMPPGMTPEMMKQASEMFKNMPEAEIERLASVMGGSSGAGVPSSAAAMGAATGVNPTLQSPAATTNATAPDASTATTPAVPSFSASAAAAGSGEPAAADQLAQAAKMMQSNPGLMKQAMNMMQNLPPEQMAAMQQQAMGGRAGLGGMPSPEQMKGMESMLQDPAMMKNMQEMLSTMAPEDLSAMSRQAGFDLSPEQAEQMTKQLKKLTPGQMSAVLSMIKYAQMAKQAMVRHKMLIISVTILLLALFLQWLGYI